MNATASFYPPVQAIAGVVIRELYRRKDFYVLFVLTALITLVLGSVNFFNEPKIVRAMKELCLFLIWLSSLVIAITTAARQIPAERENRTLFPLLAKPVTRSHLVLGKFLGCWYASGLCLLVFYLFFAVISGAREHAWPITHYFQGMVLHWFLLAIVTALALLGSIVFAAPSSNNTITFIIVTGILLLAGHLNKMALTLSEPLQTFVYAIYYVLPQFQFFDMRELIVHNRPPVPWLIWLAALGYAVVYTAVFLTTAFFLFRRKPIN